MNFNLTHAILLRLFNINSFDVPAGMVIIGLRGCLPVREDMSFNLSHELYISPYDHIHPRCTLVQWIPADRTVAVFVGSTVPHMKYIKAAKNGVGANMMLPGLYPGYTKGKHNPGKATEHDALRQGQIQAYRRTADDYDYDGDDRVETGNPHDNIHAGWTMGVNSEFFGSAGCQVLAGYPASAKLKKATGPYAEFFKNIAAEEQKEFTYALFNGNEALKVGKEKDRFPKKIRFGSTGELVGTVQKELAERKYYDGKIDNDFGPKLLEAVCKFQEAMFGESADDGVVGPQTAEQLEIKLPSLLYYSWENYETA
jgi:hypothetical protein